MTDLQANQVAAADLIMYGDLAKLTQDQRMQYLAKLCETMGLNPLTKPFEFMQLQGKMVCYAGKNCAEQLRKVHSVSLKITNRENISDVYVVTVEASLPDGRIDGATGAVPISGLKGNDLANAMMKAETKAKRRATLSICSLGMMDETEIEIISSGIRPEQPGEGNGNTAPLGYRFTFGQWKSKSIEQVADEFGIEKLRSYVAYLDGQPAKTGKPLGAGALDAIKHIEDYVGAIENQPIEETTNE